MVKVTVADEKNNDKLNENKGSELREKLIKLALEWQQEMGVAPAITTAISEYDASVLVKCSYKDFVTVVVIAQLLLKGMILNIVL